MSRNQIRIIAVIIFTCGLFLGIFLFGKVNKQLQSSGHVPSSLPETIQNWSTTQSETVGSPKPRVAQMLAVSKTLPDLDIHSLQLLEPGFVVLYGKNISLREAKRVTTKLQNLTLESPIAAVVDHEGGRVQRLKGEGFLHLNSWSSLCQLNENEFRAQIERSAQELNAAGIHIVLGPVADWAEQTTSSLGDRLCSSNHERTKIRSKEAIQIYLQHGITPTIKHFPGIGDVPIDLHNQYSEISSVQNSSQIFFELLTEFPQIAMMTAHAGLPHRNKPCSLDNVCLEIQKTPPQTLVITDDIKMISHYQEIPELKNATLSELAIQAILAGNTIILLGPDVSASETSQIISDLHTAYTNDPLFAQKVEANLSTIQQWKQNNNRLTPH